MQGVATAYPFSVVEQLPRDCEVAGHAGRWLCLALLTAASTLNCCRAVVEGEMAFIRLGTCGALRPPARLGSFIVSDPGAILIRCGWGRWQGRAGLF